MSILSKLRRHPLKEIKFGDNDTLSAITAAMISADYLFLMTDVDCLYTANPRTDPNAAPIDVVRDISGLTADVSSRGSALGTGGMSTKIVAAILATSAGVTTVITKSSKPGNVWEIVNYLEALKTQSVSQTVIQSDASTTLPSAVPSYFPDPPLHTRFLPSPTPTRDRSFWLLHGLAPHGTVYIDEGAYRALRNKAGLLPVGIVDVEGTFAQHQAVRLVAVKRIQPLSQHRTRAFVSASSQNFESDSSEPQTPTIPGTPKEALASGGLSGYSSALDFGAVDSATTKEQGPIKSDSSSTGTSKVPTPTFSVYQSQPSPLTAPLFGLSDPAPQEIGVALVNYSAVEISRIKGLQSHEIVNVLGYADSEYVALRENVSLVKARENKTDDRSEVDAKGGEGETNRNGENGEKGRAKRGSKVIGDLGSFA